ncbi:MAG TPA: hypothetical protein VFN21_09210 [Acidimicrobiales bacterium]|nr:hypothetical protein [Acidimicrobiales bacterium]
MHTRKTIGTASTGTYDPVAKTFTGLDFGSIAFSIKSIDTSNCTTGSAVCSGTASLSTHGAVLTSTAPPLNTGDQVGVLGSGSITSITSCAFPWNLVLGTSTSLSLGPNSSAPPYNATWAVFEQQ